MEVDGHMPLLAYHQLRLNHTFRHYYPGYRPHDLSELLTSESMECIQKIRVFYNESEVSILRTSYEMRPYTTLSFVHFMGHYGFKRTDRRALDDTYNRVEEGHLPLLIRDTRILETPYTNIAVQLKDKWLTPMYPLLYGTRRQSLIDQGIIDVADLHLHHVKMMKSIKLINAMIPFDESPSIDIHEFATLEK